MPFFLSSNMKKLNKPCFYNQNIALQLLKEKVLELTN